MFPALCSLFSPRLGEVARSMWSTAAEHESVRIALLYTGLQEHDEQFGCGKLDNYILLEFF